jgi:hypothetical protein
MEEKENVRSYFFELRYKVTRDVSLRAKYSYVDDKYDSFSKLELALQLNF